MAGVHIRPCSDESITSGAITTSHVIRKHEEFPDLCCFAGMLRDRALNAVDDSPTPVRWLVVAAEPVTSVDVTAADVIVELDETLKAASIELCFAEMKDPVKDKLKRFGLYARFGDGNFFATLGEAVNHYVKRYQIEWQDWDKGI